MEEEVGTTGIGIHFSSCLEKGVKFARMACFIYQDHIYPRTVLILVCLLTGLVV